MFYLNIPLHCVLIAYLCFFSDFVTVESGDFICLII